MLKIGFIFFLLLLGACAAKLSPENNYKFRLGNDNDTYREMRHLEGVSSSLFDMDKIRSSNHPKVVAWREKLDSLQSMSRLGQAKEVNVYVNSHVTYISDEDNECDGNKMGKPIATLVKGGDCEDYAILKAASFEYLNWPENLCTIVIGKSKRHLLSLHAVLVCWVEGKVQVVMDNNYNYLLAPKSHLSVMRPIKYMTKNKTYVVIVE